MAPIDFAKELSSLREGMGLGVYFCCHGNFKKRPQACPIAIWEMVFLRLPQAAVSYRFDTFPIIGNSLCYELHCALADSHRPPVPTAGYMAQGRWGRSRAGPRRRTLCSVQQHSRSSSSTATDRGVTPCNGRRGKNYAQGDAVMHHLTELARAQLELW